MNLLQLIRTLALMTAMTVTVPAMTPALAEQPASAARNSAQMTVSDIGACMRANAVDRGSLRDLRIKSTDREGKKKNLKVKIFWKRSQGHHLARMTLQVMKPASNAGTSYLMVADPPSEKLHVYLPALDRVQPVTGTDMSQPLWGTDFTFAEVKQLQGVFEDGATERKPDAEVEGRKAFVLVTKTDVEKTGYKQVRSFVDQANCTLLKAEVFVDGDKPSKIMSADLDTLLEVDPWALILGYTMRNLETGTSTRLDMSDVYLDEELPESLFTPEGFYELQP